AERHGGFAEAHTVLALVGQDLFDLLGRELVGLADDLADGAIGQDLLGLLEGLVLAVIERTEGGGIGRRLEGVHSLPAAVVRAPPMAAEPDPPPLRARRRSSPPLGAWGLGRMPMTGRSRA